MKIWHLRKLWRRFAHFAMKQQEIRLEGVRRAPSTFDLASAPLSEDADSSVKIDARFEPQHARFDAGADPQFAERLAHGRMPRPADAQAAQRRRFAAA